MLEERDSSAVALTALSGGLKLTDPTERYGGDAPTPGGSGDLPDSESRRDTVASMLDGVASRLHEKADTGGERLTGLGHGAADRVLATARYVREHDSRDVVSDLTAFAKKHPGKSLLAVAIVGFLAGRAFRDDG